MVATITAAMKRRFMDEFKNDADSSGSVGSVQYYVGIGRSEDWNAIDSAPTPVNTEREERNFRHSLQSVKLASNYSFVIPRVNWTAGIEYQAYNDATEGHPTIPYYVVTENNAVYICLRQGKKANGDAEVSSVQPTGSSTKGLATSDGYRWKFLYTIGTLDASFFKSASFIPVKLQGPTTGSSPATDVEQLAIQNAAVTGDYWNNPGGRQIVGISIDDGGAGYTSAPTVTIVGDGDLSVHSGAHAEAVLIGGSVNHVNMKDDSALAENLIEMGQGFQFASVTFDGTSDRAATGKVILGPQGGFGADPRIDLRARALMFNVKPVGSEEGEFQVGNSFRQIGLIRNPLQTDSASDGVTFTLSDGNCLRRLQMSAITTPFTKNAVLAGGDTGAVAYVDSASNTGTLELWYHQTEETGFKQFQENEPITVTTGSGIGTTQAIGTDGDTLAFHEPKVNKYSGDLLYIDNRAAVTRSADQTEDIKVIIEI